MTESKNSSQLQEELIQAQEELVTLKKRLGESKEQNRKSKKALAWSVWRMLCSLLCLIGWVVLAVHVFRFRGEPANYFESGVFLILLGLILRLK